MKKTLTIFLLVLLLCGCQKNEKKEETKPEEEPVPVEVQEPEKKLYPVLIDDGQGEQIFEAESEDDLLLNVLKAAGISFDIKGNVIDSLQGQTADPSSKWVLYLNKALYEGDIEKLRISEGDEVRFVYETTQAQIDENEPQGWIINTGYREKLSKDEKEVFAKAAEEITGVTYIPVRVVALQSLSGVNYAYLVQSKSVSGDSQPDWYISVIFKDMENYCELKALNKINIPDMQTREESDPVFLKSWMVIRTEDKAELPDKEVQKSFAKAIEGWDGLDLSPVELLASQTSKEGSDYIVLCYGETVTLDPIGDLYILEWHDQKGQTSITRLENLNLQYYVAGE